jgi:hypothetical protein
LCLSPIHHLTANQISIIQVMTNSMVMKISE